MLKHKDDIRRRLTIAEVPKPPADLVQKIKHDIPRHFTSMTAKQVDKKPRETSPLWNFWGMSWQLAAAILVLVGLTWAVFETYRSELNQAARIAEAGSKQMSVDEFEARATKTPETIRVEGSALKAKDAADEPAGNQAEPATAPSEPLGDFAREIQAPRRQDAGADHARVAAKPNDARTQESVTSGPTLAEAAPELERDVATVGTIAASEETVGQAKTAAPARIAAAAPAAPAASMDALEKKAVAAPREVRVSGLDTERIIRVELRLDDKGRVTDAVIVGASDMKVLDAVIEAAKSWTFTVDANEAVRARTTRTIDVQLRKGD